MARKANSKEHGNRKSNRKSKKQQNSHADDFRKLLDWLLPDHRIFSVLKLHGNTSWLPQSLVCLALCWAWAENKHVTDAFTYAADWCRCLVGGSPLSTYQGMMNALVRWTDALLPILWKMMHQKMKQIGGQYWEIGGWVPIAFDGSRDTAPRTVANEDAFCAKNHGKGKTAKYRKKNTKGMRRTNNEKNKAAPPVPQVWITLMWHVGLRLPWMWRLGPSNSSERDHVMDMIKTGNFPKNTLFCGDAGFIGYPLWSLIIEQGYQFLVRVGGNVSLLLEQGNVVMKGQMLVLSWTQQAKKAGLPPLRLRLVKVKVGKTWMWLLTSIRDKSELNVSQIRELYKQRWGIEVEFRGLKQTLNKRNLRCRNEKRVKAELHWSILGMAVAELFALKEQQSKRRSHSASKSPPPPQKRSLAGTAHALRWSLTHLKEVPEADERLPQRLRRALTDDYDRTAAKGARYRPPNPDKKPLGNPKIRKLTAEERRVLKQFPNRKLLV